MKVPAPLRRRRSRTPDIPPPPWRWALLGLLLGSALAIALWAPARWLAHALALASEQRVQLSDTSGSLWNGSARLTLAGGQGSRDRLALPGQVRWQLRPHWGGVRLRLHADCCTVTHQPLTLQLRPRWGGAQLDVANAQSHWPASVLTGLGTPWNTLQPQGDLALTTQGLSLHWAAGRLQLTGQADIRALHTASRLSTLRPLGSYQLRIEGGSAIRLTLHTLPDSALLLNGQGQWVGQRLHFRGEAQAAPGHEAALANLLNIIGPRQGDKALLNFG